jgi:hypothetical protein
MCFSAAFANNWSTTRLSSRTAVSNANRYHGRWLTTSRPIRTSLAIPSEDSSSTTKIQTYNFNAAARRRHRPPHIRIHTMTSTELPCKRIREKVQLTLNLARNL